jgi:5-methyltetrahydropteroyltriglutamate--homocysteine methyltransferase
MRSSQERILTTHTGSLPRPGALVDLYAVQQRGDPVDPEALATLGRQAVSSIIARQADTGIDVGNDGEQRRDSFVLHLKRRLTGLGGAWQRPPRADVERYPIFKAMQAKVTPAPASAPNQSALPTAIGPVRHTAEEAVAAECADFVAALEERGNPFVEPFLTAPSPGILATTIRNDHYDSQQAYLDALGRAVQVEYEAIADAGLLLQLDCPDLALERHILFADGPLSAFLDFAEMVVDTINRALVNIPRDRVRMHVCWGNSETPHDCDVPLAEILPVLARANVGALVLPFSSPRHAHEYRCLSAGIAEDQLVVAGVVDSLTNVVEHPEVVADRIERVANAVGDPRRVLAGTDCGFDTAAGFGRVAEDVVWAKLATLVEGARIASGRLFPQA